MSAKPFLKWAGGKTQLLDKIVSMLPSKINNYYEPFLGGGALFFELKRLGLIKRQAFLFDANQGLVNAYNQLKYNLNDVVYFLKYHSLEHNKDKYEYFYACRNRYNVEPKDTAFSASLFIYLNKTCFNGLYRENAAGEFNVPIGGYKNPQILDIENLTLVSEALQDATITCVDFIYLLSLQFDESDFVYLDPPYYPADDSESFTSYTKKGFSFNDQVGLRNLFQWLGDYNPSVSVMLSNSDTTFIRELYSGIKSKIENVEAKRSIRSKGNKTRKASELIITNYDTQS